MRFLVALVGVAAAVGTGLAVFGFLMRLDEAVRAFDVVRFLGL